MYGFHKKIIFKALLRVLKVFLYVVLCPAPDPQHLISTNVCSMKSAVEGTEFLLLFYVCELSWKDVFYAIKKQAAKNPPQTEKKNKTKHQPAIEMLMSSWRPSDIGQIPGSGLNKSSTLNGINKTICLSKKGKKGEREEKKKGGGGEMWGQ